MGKQKENPDEKMNRDGGARKWKERCGEKKLQRES